MLPLLLALLLFELPAEYKRDEAARKEAERRLGVGKFVRTDKSSLSLLLLLLLLLLLVRIEACRCCRCSMLRSAWDALAEAAEMEEGSS